MLTDIDLPLVDRRHQLAQLVLPLAGDLQRAIGDERLEKIQLGANQFCVQIHAIVSFQCFAGFAALNIYYIIVRDA